jgi:hypothetical protein
MPSEPLGQDADVPKNHRVTLSPSHASYLWAARLGPAPRTPPDVAGAPPTTVRGPDEAARRFAERYAALDARRTG